MGFCTSAVSKSWERNAILESGKNTHIICTNNSRKCLYVYVEKRKEDVSVLSQWIIYRVA